MKRSLLSHYLPLKSTCILVYFTCFLLHQEHLSAQEKKDPPPASHHHHHHDPDEDQETAYSSLQKQHLQQKAYLFDLDQELVKLTQNRIQKLRKHTRLFNRLSRLQTRLDELEKQMERERLALLKGMALRRRLKSARLAEMFLNADGPFDLKRREVYLERIFRGYTTQLVSFDQTRKDFEKHKKELVPLEAEVRVLLEDLQNQEAILVQKRQEEWGILADLNQTLQNDSTLNKKTTLRSFNVKQAQDPFKNQNQPLVPPVRGQWKDRFKRFRGYALSRLYGNGLEIKGDAFAPIYSIYQGQVSYVGQVRAWGHVVIIDHQNGLTSLYAGLAESTVTEGQQVSTQFRIGSMGNVHQTPSLYFELRKLGFPIDPKRWLDSSFNTTQL